ncbi:MAG: metallophosphoesterase family protein [Rubripirellula sp.]
MNHVQVNAWSEWIESIASHGAQGIVITGDISEGDDVVFQLRRMVETLNTPIYFVLGNHDFYRSSFHATRQAVIHACRDHPLLHYLTDLSAIELAPAAYLVGEDGWGDATVGDFETSTIRLNDFPQIQDFNEAPTDGWKQQLHDLGAEAAARLTAKLTALPEDTKQVVVLTHVPPFREACWYEGNTTDDNWAPFFVCGQLGSVLREKSQARPDCQFRVLCGHTHHAGIAQISPNLIVHTGAAAYGHPDIEGIVSVTSSEIRVANSPADDATS